jgi:two-component system sensor histidine kinase UhpB
MRNSAVPIRDEQQAIVGAVVVNEDVTRQVRAEEELRWKRVQLQALSRQLIEAQEAERRAVARELHDDFGQVLTALKLHLGRKDRDDAESIALVDGAIARMRDLAHDLRPPMLDELGLEASLRWYVEREARRAGLEFDLALSPVEPRPPPAVESTCFRVAQEALTNVIRHAQARRVEVELGIADGALQLVVRDDGRGFDVADARRRAIRGESQGLLGMQERVDLAGGDLEMESTPGQGTAVRARFPIPPAAPGGK